MRSDPEGVVSGFYQAFASGDQASQMTYFSDDATFFQHVPEGIVPYGGERLDKARISERLAYMYANWENLGSYPLGFRVEGDEVTCQMQFHFRFKATGSEIEGRMRHVFRIVDGRIASLDEYLDVGLLDAFMRFNATEMARAGRA